MIVTPVGTCRITTPLRRASQRGEVSLDLGGVYGFVHTSREALQMVRHLNGDFDIPPGLSDLVTRPEHKPTSPGTPELLLVEISSLKDVRIGEVSLQLNYMQRRFGDFFLDKERAKQFWRLAGSDENLKTRRKWLDGLDAFRQLSPDDRDRLATITRHMLTKKDVEADIRGIVKAAGKTPVAVVSHIDAHKPDGTTIASRGELIEWLSGICRKLDIPFFNPTDLLDTFGQTIAMEKGGRDLTHYTPAFSDAIFNAMVAEGIISKPHDSVPDEIAVRIQEAIELIREDRIPEAGRLAYKLLETEARPEVEELVAALESHIGNHKSALQRLSALREQDFDLSEDSRKRLMSALFSAGDYERALAEANSLLAEETESEGVFRTAALSAEALGRAEEAIGFWSVLHGQGSGEATEGLIRLGGTTSAVNDLARTELKRLPDAQVPASVLWRHFVDTADYDSARVAARHLRDLDEDEVQELVSYAEKQPRHQAELARILHGSGRLSDGVVESLLSKFEANVTQGGDDDDVSRLAAASALVTLGKSDAHKARLRELRTDVRRGLASRQREGDHDGVLNWASRISGGSVSIPGASFFAGRSAMALGKHEDAVRWFRRAKSEAGADTANSLALIRALDMAGRQMEAYEEAQELLSGKGLEAPDQQKLDALLASMKTRSIKRLRQYIDAEQLREASSMLELMSASGLSSDLLEGERRRLKRAMQHSLSANYLDDPSDAKWLGDALLEMQPDHQRALKAMASLAMRERRFEDARALWSRLAETRDNPKTALAQVAKCDSLLARQAA